MVKFVISFIYHCNSLNDVSFPLFWNNNSGAIEGAVLYTVVHPVVSISVIALAELNWYLVF